MSTRRYRSYVRRLVPALAVRLPLYHAGLEDETRVRRADGTAETAPLDRAFRAAVTVRVPARGHAWLVVEAP